MRRESWSIVAACAFGACIGSLISLDIAARFQSGRYLWGIGALFGGIVAYVAIDFRHFCTGVAHSYHRTIAWRPYGLYWRAIGSELIAGVAIIPTIMTAIVVFFGTLMAFDRTVPSYTLTGVFIYTPLCIMVVSLLVLLLTVGPMLLTNMRGRQEPEKWAERLNRNIQSNWDMAREMNLAAVTIFLVRHAVGILWHSVVHAPHAAMAGVSTVKQAGKILGAFIAGVFIYVHSEWRTICFVGAALGSAIGYSLGNAIYGAIAGAVLGFISYEIVSVRWLRLVPQRSRN